MKRFWAMILAAAMCLSLTGCRSSSEKESIKQAMDEINGYSTVNYTLADGTVLERTVIYDKNDIRITVLGLTGDTSYPELWVLMENNRGEVVDFIIDSICVNGWEIDSSLYLEVEKKSVGMDSAWLPLEEMGSYAPAVISTISFTGRINDSDYDQIDTFTQELQTSAYGQEDSTVPTGVTLYDNNDVRLVYLGTEGDSYSTYLRFYAENNGTAAVVLESEGVYSGLYSWEENLTDSMYGESISAGSRRIISLYALDDDFDEESYSSTMQMDLEVINEDTYETIESVYGIYLCDGTATGEKNTGISSEGQVLYDANQVQLVYQGLWGDEDDAEFRFYVRNDREEDIWLTSDECIFYNAGQGLYYDDLSYSIDEYIGAGEETVLGIPAYLFDLLDEEGLTFQEVVGMPFHLNDLQIYSAESDELLAELVDVILVGNPLGQLSGSGGELVYNTDDFSLLYQGMETEKGISYVQFYAENKSEEDIPLLCNSFHLSDGGVLYVFFNQQVPAGQGLSFRIELDPNGICDLLEDGSTPDRFDTPIIQDAVNPFDWSEYMPFTMMLNFSEVVPGIDMVEDGVPITFGE